MRTRSTTRSTFNYPIALLILAGLLFMTAGGILAAPFIRDALLPPPNFGEVEPMLLPTVTPIPAISYAAAPATPVVVRTETPPATPYITSEQNQAPSISATTPSKQNQTPSISATAVVTELSVRTPTRIVIPAINLDAPIEPVRWKLVKGVSTWQIPNHFAAGWLMSSALLGRPGNTVLSGHHNTGGEVFRRLVDLKEGDVIEVYADERRLRYEVKALHILLDRDQPLEVQQRNAVWIQPTRDERLTLVTCWPYSSNTHRLIVVAKPIGSWEAAPESP